MFVGCLLVGCWLLLLLNVGWLLLVDGCFSLFVVYSVLFGDCWCVLCVMVWFDVNCWCLLVCVCCLFWVVGFWLLDGVC